MSVISLEIRPANDPLGTPLVTLTDEDLATFSLRKAENSLGAGSFKLRRGHAAATAANLAEDNYVVVTVPIISAEPLFGFFLEHHDDLVLAQGEEGAESLTREGPGSLAIVGRANFLDQHYAPAPPASDDRGSANEVRGYWRWQHKQFGQIFVRLLEEGQNQPGTPLADVTFDFDRDVDSDGTDWPAIDRDVRFEIGTGGLTFMDRFAATGEVFIEMDPDFTAHARQARGVDRTSGSFASGKVRLVKSVNINTELTREGDGSLAATHAIVVGMENTYVQVVSPSYSPGDAAKWLRVDYDNSNDIGVLEKVGLEALARGFTELQEITMEIKAGDDEASGRYLPFKHFDTGDLITLHTGSGANDYNEQAERIRAFTIELRDASDDTAKGDISGAEMAARSLIVKVECGGVAGSFGISLDVKVEDKGCGGCPEPPVVTNPPDVTGLTCVGLDLVEYPFTADGSYGALGPVVPFMVGMDTRYKVTTTDQITYGGPAAAEYPSPGVDCDLGNGGVAGCVLSSGGVDYFPASASGLITLTVIGPGVATIHTSVHIGGMSGPCIVPMVSTDLNVVAHASTAGTVVDSVTATVGDIVTITIPDDGLCAHYISISTLQAWGFGGFTWAPLFTTIPILDQKVRSVFTGDGVTTSHVTPGTPPLAYDPDTLTLTVGGLDWTSVVTFSDPASGEYTTPYPIPVCATAVLEFKQPHP